MRILVIEDDSATRKVMVEALRRDLTGEAEVVEAGALDEALRIVQSQTVDLAVSDVMLPATAGDLARGRIDPRAGVKLIEAIGSRQPDCRIVVVSSQERELAVQLLVTHRIHDYIFKDTPWKEIRARIEAQVEKIRLTGENRELKLRLGEEGEVDLVGRAPEFLRVIERARQVAPTDASVLITGETGTGKELVARLIHRHSRRSQAPFVVVNCAALSESLLESELFGHAKGAFTGALESRIGRFELADGGTLFLDEVGEIPLHVQPKLLRVLQEQTFERVGESRTRKVTVRLVSATNRDLEKESAQRRFRLDLFHRLNVFCLELPPLRRRVEDIPPLAHGFMQELGRKLGKSLQGIEPAAERALCRAPWPGNVRQLKNTIESAMIVECTATLSLGSLPMLQAREPGDGSPETPGSYREALLGFERAFLERALRRERGDTSRVAESIDLPVRTLRFRLQRCGLDPAAYR